MRLAGGSDIESGALVLIGDAASFRHLAGVLRRSEQTAIELEPPRERPAIRPIGVLRFEPAERMASVRISGDAATLRGNLESFARLADEIELLLEYNDLAVPGMHFHIDVPPASIGGGLLAPDSRSLILAGPIPDDVALS